MSIDKDINRNCQFICRSSTLKASYPPFQLYSNLINPQISTEILRHKISVVSNFSFANQGSIGFICIFILFVTQAYIIFYLTSHKIHVLYLVCCNSNMLLSEGIEFLFRMFLYFLFGCLDASVRDDSCRNCGFIFTCFSISFSIKVNYEKANIFKNNYYHFFIIFIK